MVKQKEQNSSKPVEYYNIYNLDNRDKIDNKYVKDGVLNRDNICLSDGSGLAPSSLSASQETHLGGSGAQAEPVVCISPEECPLTPEMISRTVVQFFDNGEGIKQRYKLKLRFNLVDKENPEFIAPLTKDWGNFKKYIPQESREEVMEEVREWRKQIKQQYGTFPYIGKFHLNTGPQQGATRGFIQVEPFTYGIVWYSPNAEHWMCAIRFYDWNYRCDLITGDVTKAQAKVGVKAQHLFINPIHDKRERPLTWAERRAQQGK
jgi:hypothetical protein